MSKFDFDKFVAGQVFLTEHPYTSGVMSVYSNYEAAISSYEVVKLHYIVREINLLTSSFKFI